MLLSKYEGAFLFLPSLVWAIQPQDVVISEIAWMGTSNGEFKGAYEEWLELKNNTDQNIDLTNWILKSRDNKPTIILEGIVPAYGYFLLERSDDKVTSILANQIYTGTLSDTGEELILLTPNDIEVDRTLNEAWAAGNKDEKRTMIRTDFSGTGSGAWSTYSGSGSEVTDINGNLILGTPENSIFIPEKLPIENIPKLLISEVSPKNDDGDFIEIYSQEDANLKGVSVKKKKILHGRFLSLIMILW